MFYNPALISQLRARPITPGAVTGTSAMMAPAPGAPQGTGVGGTPPAGQPTWGQGMFGSAYARAGNNKVNLPYFEEDRNRLGGMLGGQSPFAGGEWGGLIAQLQDRAAGRGPSIAGDAFNQASQSTQAAIASMSRGSGSAAAGRQGLIQQGRVGQGMAQGYASARNQEMMGAQSALTQALSQRDQLNQNAYLDILARQLGLSKDQLVALQGNQQDASNRRAQDKAASAAKWNAIGGAAGGLGSIF